MRDNIRAIMVVALFPLILMQGAFFGSAIDHNSMVAFIIFLILVVVSAIDFALVLVSCLVEK